MLSGIEFFLSVGLRAGRAKAGKQVLVIKGQTPRVRREKVGNGEIGQIVFFRTLNS